jgi:hypothetical protein
MTDRRLHTLFAVGCAVVIAVESYVLFFDRDQTFSIQGRNPYLLSEFGDGIPITHAFLMRGNGLRAVRVQFSSSAPAMVRLRWRLLRQPLSEEQLSIMEGGMREVRFEAGRIWARSPIDGATDELSVMEEGTRELPLEAGRTWATFPVTRDGSSHDRWYAFEAQLVDLPDRSASARAGRWLMPDTCW